MRTIVRGVCVRFLLLSAALGVSVVACASDGASATKEGLLGTELGAGDPGDPGEPFDSPPPGEQGDKAPPKRPPLCKTQAECANACPPGSKGCTCHALPDGNSVCAPTCSADADCPALPSAPPLACRDGVCAPPPPPPPPKACETETDCADACPPGAKGCACRPAPKADKICVPVCSQDADCPALPFGPPLACHDGTCAPPPPPKPPAR